MFERTGGYFANREIQDGERWLSCDRACDSGPTVECHGGFEVLFEPYPGQ